MYKRQVIHIAVHNGVGVIFHIGVSRDRSVDGFALAQLRQLGLLVGCLLYTSIWAKEKTEEGAAKRTPFLPPQLGHLSLIHI